MLLRQHSMHILNWNEPCLESTDSAKFCSLSLLQSDFLQLGSYDIIRHGIVVTVHQIDDPLFKLAQLIIKCTVYFIIRYIQSARLQFLYQF